MAKWIEAGSESDIPKGGTSCLEVSGFPIVICHVDGVLIAASNICPHAGMPIGDGDLIGPNLTCPYHAYTYNLKTGKNIDEPDDTPLMRFPLRIVDGRIEIELPIDG